MSAQAVATPVAASAAAAFGQPKIGSRPLRDSGRRALKTRAVAVVVDNAAAAVVVAADTLVDMAVGMTAGIGRVGLVGGQRDGLRIRMEPELPAGG